MPLVRYEREWRLTMAQTVGQYGDRIVKDPAILTGKPVVRGTRIPVDLVLAKLSRNPDLNDLFEDYPRLTVEDVKACLEYALTLVEREHIAERRASA
jgi:uncharacterized protein (DUF433 family)